MKILIFGVSNVGKTTIGSILAVNLGYDFFDLDEEVKRYYHTTLEDFVNGETLEIRDQKRGVVLDELMKNENDKVIAITPISYPVNFNHHLCRNDVLAIELRDTAGNIFDRLVFSDENDNVYKDDDYKNAHKEHYIEEICEDISWYGKTYVNVKNKFDVNNELPDVVVKRLMKEFGLPVI